MRTSALVFTLAAVAALAHPAAAQRDSEEWLQNCRRGDWNNGREVHCEVRESRIPARGTLTVDGGQNGGVTVRAWDGRDVLVRARVQASARSEDAARDMARAVRVNTDGTIRASGPDAGRNEHWAVSYEILVPARTSLDVRTHNGGVTVERITGNMNLRAHNGPMNLTDVAGDITARTTNGPVNVRLAGTRWNGEGLDAETTNGPVNVHLPRGYRAHLVASTVHGPIRLPRGIDAEPRGRGRNRWNVGGSVDTELNGGGPRIRAVTTNGPVIISGG